MINKIDAHQHFWRYDPIDYSWINEEMLNLKTDFLPDDLLPVLTANGVEGTVAVQALQDEKENEFLLELAENHPFILGVVGWIDLKSPNLAARLSNYDAFNKLKGFRHVLQDEEDSEYILNEAFQRGLSAMFDIGYSYDLLVLPHQLKGAIKTVSNFEKGSFILDHLAKPDIKTGQNEKWKDNIKALAEFPNVYCKLSGMITEAAWSHWEEKEFYPYMDTVMEAFGEDRVMFGSDWPVCKLAGSYEQVIGLVEGYFKGHSESTLQKIWYSNAVNFYRL
ncbi:amidohydrolase family protein [Cyclobacterium qasimii]|uniref:L-fuconolactone hydrolase n=2 Tax=Cyclobacterium qasimii TaxID=1350429 RepID=S7VDF5_9BACT|nr:amidohydrolase family protein [Cyclobacterium qasimii]EPR68245.1 L-fuconolactone hydrolase [Cyclobacterium qasimii M12-11B]GEO19817.1 amidohydrolase [Cyclobacterium qasimii]